MFGGSPPVETYRVDQSVVALFLAPTALGYYVAALAFTNLPRFVAQSFAIVANPAIARQPTHEAATRSMWRFFWISLPCLSRRDRPPVDRGARARALSVRTGVRGGRRHLEDPAGRNVPVLRPTSTRRCRARGGIPGYREHRRDSVRSSRFSPCSLFSFPSGAWMASPTLLCSPPLSAHGPRRGTAAGGIHGKAPPAWLEIRSDTDDEDSVAVADVAHVEHASRCERRADRRLLFRGSLSGLRRTSQSRLAPRGAAGAIMAGPRTYCCPMSRETRSARFQDAGVPTTTMRLHRLRVTRSPVPHMSLSWPASCLKSCGFGD